MGKEKKLRQRKIVAIIQSRTVETQEELVEILKAQGMDATQASVSRDLVDLNVIKMHGRYVVNGEFPSIVNPGAVTLAIAGDALIVIRCGAGMASAVGRTIDRASVPEVMGTVAGDDTIFIAVAGKQKQKITIDKLKRLFVVEEMK